MGTRLMRVYKETADQPWRSAGWDKSRRWSWICRTCRLGTTYPKATLSESYADALEHLEDEHLGASTLSYP